VGLTFVLMIAFEILQLIGISSILREYNHWILNLLAVLIGTKFSIVDILVYAIGLSGVTLVELKIITGNKD
jgi:hypothetical protein